jgi:carboxymethylenebutenolidase
MCYSDDARPPLPPVVGGAASDHGDFHLTASDGNRFMAYHARAAHPTGSGMVVLGDVRGLHPFYKELAIRFAEAGVDTVAMDYFGRTAESEDRGEGFDWRAEVAKTTPEGIAADVRASVDYLGTADGGRPRATFTVGFCWGGSNSWSQIAEGHGLAGAIGFYGGGPERILPLVPQMQGELLFLLAGDDFTTAEQFEKVASEVRAGGIPVESHTYPGAPHSFFDRSYAEHQNACDDAWRRMLAFMERLTPPAQPK